ncbi:MAG: tetratricopeptide repeat protein [Polyangiaceae bacterium]|nr:tetratricopeptide repeat protein [Polyangiaceae bacterium]
MRSNKGRVAALGLAGLLLAAPMTARASEDDSKTLFAQGRELRTAGKCDQAILAFRRALELNPSGLGSLRNIAECEEKLRLYASARRSYWDLRRAVLQSNEPKYQGWDKDAEAAYRALEAKVAKLTIVLRGDKLERASMKLDGKPLDPRLAGVEIERDLGLHTIEVHYGGAAPVTSKVTLAEGQRETVTIDVPSPSTAKPPPPPPSGSSELRTGGIIALGVGGAGLVGMAVAIAVRSSALSDIEASCPGHERCPESLRGRYETGVTASTMANVFGGIAIAGAGAGAAMLVLSQGSGGTGEPQSAAIGIMPSWAGARVHAIVRF